MDVTWWKSVQVEPSTLVPLVHGCRQVFLVRTRIEMVFTSRVYAIIIRAMLLG
jgi:hypothetical protein